MITEYPKFMDSPYFVDEPGNWHLKPGAPPEVVEEFNKFMEDTAEEDSEPNTRLSGSRA